ncbi:hypothetical protein ACFLYA_02205, partial [Candidatus Dependentiae bacterium]
GANIHKKDSVGAKAIHYAARSAHIALFDYLLKKEKTIRDDNPSFAFYHMTHELILKRCFTEKKKLIKEYFAIPFDSWNEGIAHFLLQSKKITIIKKIINKYGINLNRIHSPIGTPYTNEAELRLKKLQLLLNNGAEITIKNVRHEQLLIDYHRQKLLDFIVQNGINANKLGSSNRFAIDQGTKITITLNSANAPVPANTTAPVKNIMTVSTGSNLFREFDLNTNTNHYLNATKTLFWETLQAQQELAKNVDDVGKYLAYYLYLKDKTLLEKKWHEKIKKHITEENPDTQYQDYKELQESTLADTYLAELITALQKTKENIRRKRNIQMGIETIAPMYDKIIALNKLAGFRKNLYQMPTPGLDSSLRKNLIEKEDIESIVFSYDLLKDKKFGPLRKLIIKNFNHCKDANGHTIYQAMANYKEYLPYLMCKDYFTYFFYPNLKESLFQKILWGDIKKDEKDLVTKKINSKICHLQNEYKYIRKNKKYYSRIKRNRSYLNNEYHKTFVNTCILFFLLANSKIPLYEKDPKTNKRRKKSDPAVIPQEIAAKILEYWNGELDGKSYFIKPAQGK